MVGREETTMGRKPESVEAFLGGKRFAVAGVSRDGKQAANAVYRKLRGAGYEVVPVNPQASQVEGTTCYPDLLSVPGSLDGVVIATHPAVALDVVRQARERGMRHAWFHRSFGQGSVSDEAVREAKAAGMNCIVGGCPLMYAEPVDVLHRCMCWWLGRTGRIVHA
jgi:predicted CoA-binding protein